MGPDPEPRQQSLEWSIMELEAQFQRFRLLLLCLGTLFQRETLLPNYLFRRTLPIYDDVRVE